MISLFSFVFYTVLIVVSCEKNIFSSTKSSLDFSNNKNIILLVGNSGSGKSTLIHYVAGDPSKLISIKSSNNIDLNIKNEDPENSSITSSTVLQTFVPVTMIDEQQNMWYNYPSFTDIKNHTVELTNTVFIKSIIESISNMKIVIVVDFESVKNSHIRCDFDSLLSSTAKLIKNVKHFENSLSLVVTKAPSSYIYNRRIIEISEENVKNTTAEFLFEHRFNLLKNGTDDEKILLIDALLKQSEEEIYPKISVFWKPDEFGRLSEIEKFVKGRELIRKSILEHTSYTQIQSNDFKFPLSDEAILNINYMEDEAVESFNLQVKNISDRLLNEVNQTIQSQHDFDKVLKNIRNAQSKIENYKNIDAFKLKNFTELLRELIKEIGLQSTKDEFIQIERDENYLNVLKSLADRYVFIELCDSDPCKNHSREINYKQHLNEICDLFEKCETDIKNKIKIKMSQVMNNISMSLTNIDQQLLVALQEKLHETNGIENKLNLQQSWKKSIQSIGNAKTLEQRIKQLSILILDLNITSINISACNQMVQDNLYLNEIMSILKSEPITPVVDSWIANSSSAINFVTFEYDWNSFLFDVYNFMASYEVQMDIRAYNVRELSNWGQLGKPQGLEITSANFKEFIQRFSNSTDFVPTPSKLNDLNQIIDTTLNSAITHRFYSENYCLIIEGIFVKSSDIPLVNSTNASKREIKKINVFVADTFYVDSDLNLNGIENLELHILANKWNILQPTTFRLNGIDGASQAPPTTNGTAGKAGIRGTNSGNFFGVANEMINGNALTIELIGGNGGNGQDGTGNQDINIFWKTDEHGKTDYYPTDCYNDLITFQSEPIKKIFTQANYTCSYARNETSSLIGKEVIYTQIIFPNNCCGVTGKGGVGGLGGVSGYSRFIHITDSGKEHPNIVKMNGIDGKSGQNATPCKTAGVQCDSNGIFNNFIDCYIYFDQFTRKSIDDYHCPDKYVTNTDITSTPPLTIPFLASATINEYKRFLLENIKNPILEKFVQKTYDAIKSNHNIDDTI